MNLPEGYTYIPVKNNENNTIYRIKELTSGSAAEAWVKEFSKQSYVTWRVMKTYPKAGRKNVFRKDYRCQHLTDKRVTGVGPSKNTDCPAVMMVFVRRYKEHTRSKNVDRLTKEYPGMIVLKREHNHPIFSTDTLHHIAPSPEKEEKQAALFCQDDIPNTPSVSSNLPSLTEEEKMKYQALLDRIQEGLSANPALFVPAVKKMLKNADAFASTERGLAFAMHTFGLYSGVKATTRTATKRLVQHSHKTSVCKKLLLSGEKKIKVCQPIIIRELPRELSNHNYTSSGILAKTKLNKT